MKPGTVKDLYVIIKGRSEDILDFWNNNEGWTFSIEDASVFTLEETRKLHLPIEGEWLLLINAFHD